jgi:hypothetical protein
MKRPSLCSERDIEQAQERNDQDEDPGPFIPLEQPEPADDFRESHQGQKRSQEQSDESKDPGRDRVDVGYIGDPKEKDEQKHGPQEAQDAEDDPKDSDDFDVILHHGATPYHFNLREDEGKVLGLIDNSPLKG